MLFVQLPEEFVLRGGERIEGGPKVYLRLNRVAQVGSCFGVTSCKDEDLRRITHLRASDPLLTSPWVLGGIRGDFAGRGTGVSIGANCWVSPCALPRADRLLDHAHRLRTRRDAPLRRRVGDEGAERRRDGQREAADDDDSEPVVAAQYPHQRAVVGEDAFQELAEAECGEDVTAPSPMKSACIA